MKARTKQVMAMALVLALAAVGAMLLLVDYSTVKSALIGCGLSLAFFIAAGALFTWFDNKKIITDDNA